MSTSTPPCPHGLAHAAMVLGVDVAAIAEAVGEAGSNVAVGDSAVMGVWPT